MTTKELTIKILESTSPDWYKTKEVNFNLITVSFEKTFKGLSEFYKYVKIQSNGYEKIEKLPTQLIHSKTFFQNNLKNLEDFINRYTRHNSSQLDQSWRTLTTQNNQRKITLSDTKVFPFNSEFVSNIIEINEINTEFTNGAFSYFTKSPIGNTKNDFIGGLLAYEFENPKSILSKRNYSARKKIEELNQRVEELLSENETQLLENITKSKSDYQSYVDKIDEFKNSKEELFDDWYAKATKDFNVFDRDSKKKINHLEEVYFRKLQLSKPAKYWEKKSTKFYSDANKSKKILLWMIGISSIFLALILFISPEWIFDSVFSENKSAIIRWSLVFITLISLIAFGIRAITKVMFSSFHLARDAEERHTLTFFYLSLLQERDSKINDEDRKLILQSLFSRAETGLLKDDSGPTMPNDFIGKIMNK
jgi:hypothetical protein